MRDEVKTRMGVKSFKEKELIDILKTQKISTSI
jgi:hypothetical protein